MESSSLLVVVVTTFSGSSTLVWLLFLGYKLEYLYKAGLSVCCREPLKQAAIVGYTVRCSPFISLFIIALLLSYLVCLRILRP